MHPVMRTALLLLLVICSLLSGCAATDPLVAYEADDLMVVKHNEYNNYVLMVYRDPLGQTRHVLRRNGITELTVHYAMDGQIQVKLRGQKPRKIDAFEAGRIIQRINSLLSAKSKGAAVLTRV